MKNISATSTGTFILAIVFSCCFSNAYAQTSQNQESAETKQITTETSQETKELRPKATLVKMTDFYLRDGELVFGKLISESKNKITVEQLAESKIVVSTYSKREIDSRTLHVKTVPEFKYYLELAEYFSGRSWDFRNDPDDFIQAIRCHERAKRLIAETQTQDDEKIEQINQSLEHLQADRQVLMREVESRARLKKLEFEAEIEKRLNELEDKVDASSRQIDESIADMKDSYEELGKSIAELTKDISQQENSIRANRRLIDRIDYRVRWYYPPQYYYPYRRRPEPNGDQ